MGCRGAHRHELEPTCRPAFPGVHSFSKSTQGLLTLKAPRHPHVEMKGDIGAPGAHGLPLTLLVLVGLVGSGKVSAAPPRPPLSCRLADLAPRPLSRRSRTSLRISSAGYAVIRTTSKATAGSSRPRSPRVSPRAGTSCLSSPGTLNGRYAEHLAAPQIVRRGPDQL